jgi:hypothetical protein
MDAKPRSSSTIFSLSPSIEISLLIIVRAKITSDQLGNSRSVICVMAVFSLILVLYTGVLVASAAFASRAACTLFEHDVNAS